MDDRLIRALHAAVWSGLLGAGSAAVGVGVAAVKDWYYDGVTTAIVVGISGGGFALIEGMREYRRVQEPKMR